MNGIERSAFLDHILSKYTAWSKELRYHSGIKMCDTESENMVRNR